MTKFSFKHCDIISHRQVNQINLLPCFDANMGLTVSFCQILRNENAIIFEIGSTLLNNGRLNKLCWTKIIDISIFLGCVRYMKDQSNQMRLNLGSNHIKRYMYCIWLFWLLSSMIFPSRLFCMYDIGICTLYDTTSIFICSVDRKKIKINSRYVVPRYCR